MSVAAVSCLLVSHSFFLSLSHFVYLSIYLCVYVYMYVCPCMYICMYARPLFPWRLVPLGPTPSAELYYLFGRRAL